MQIGEATTPLRYYSGSLVVEQRSQFLGSDSAGVLFRLVGNGATPKYHDHYTTNTLKLMM